MATPLPPLAAVRAFEAAARLTSFTEAAQALGMTQAAVSYQIKLLEERLGVPLFDRVGRRVELTAQGQALAPVIITAFDQIRAGFASLRTDAGAVLTVGCFTSFAHLWLAPRIGKFQMLQPDLAVRIQAVDHIVDLARDGIDLTIRGGTGSWPGLGADLLMRNLLTPVCSPEFLARIGPVAGAAALFDLPRLSPQDDWWDQWFTAMDVDNADRASLPGLALDSQALDGRAAMAGQGIAIVNRLLWKREIDAGLLVEPVPSHVLQQSSYWVAYPQANRNLPKIKAFRDWLQSEMAAERAQDPDGRFLPAI